jgi:hypothetical protein
MAVVSSIVVFASPSAGNPRGADEGSDASVDPLFERAPDFRPMEFAETVGAYAIYRDARPEGEAYIGICYLGGNELAIRLFESASGNELLFTQTWYVSSGKAAPGTISLVRGSFDSSPLAGRVDSLVAEFADAWLASRDRFAEESEFAVAGETPGYDFRYWVPVFRVYASGIERENPETGEGSVALATAGIAQSGSDAAFYDFDGFPKAKTGPVDAIAAGSPRVVSVDGFSVPLDSNWAEGDDGIWRVARKGAQDAAFLIESLDLSDYGDRDVFDLIRLLVLNSGWRLLPEDLRIFVFNERPCVHYRVFDPETETVTVQYKMFIPRGESRFSLVSLSIYEPLYEANRDYFDSILF